MLSAIARTCNNIAPFAANAGRSTLQSARVRADHELCAVEAIPHMAASNAAVMRRDVRATARYATSVPRARTAPRAVCARGAGRTEADGSSVRAALPANTYSFDTAFSTCNSSLNVQSLDVCAAAAREEQPLAAPILFNALLLAAPQPPLVRSCRSGTGATLQAAQRPRVGDSRPRQLNV